MSVTTTKRETKSRPIMCVVSSDKMNKSRVATIEHLVKHPIYKKYIRRTSKLMFHDENNETRTGDKVLVKQSKPLSARKRFTLLEVVEKAKTHLDPKLLGEG